MLSKIKIHTTKFLNPISRILCYAGVKPNHITFLGLLTGFAASYFVALYKPLIGCGLILFSGFMDMLDGALARNCGKVSAFGGFLDSVFDRYVDVAIFIALGYYTKKWIIAMLAMSGALLVSYTRARAEHVIDRCDVGIAERSERLLIIVAGLLSGYVWQALAITAILAHITALHRVLYTHQTLKRERKWL
ncbi:MAG: CDP-alcohol phosphatidyltransferase family protein [Archaeoglobus sp.]|nr:MAG: CDP-alcohol phosphatidyltransferase family protein [Archaeoglobus sp.]